MINMMLELELQGLYEVQEVPNKCYPLSYSHMVRPSAEVDPSLELKLYAYLGIDYQ